jgi:DNA-binding winged helix-turn-helix (wHTH) protein
MVSAALFGGKIRARQARVSGAFQSFARVSQETVVGIRFASFVLDLDTRQLTRAGTEVPLTPKAFELLAILVEERPKVVSKAMLMERLWPGTFVVEANVSNLVAEIRAALGDRAREPKWIRTVHGFGYAFCGRASTLRHGERPPAGRPVCWLEWGRRRFPLDMGEHVVGRDPAVEVRLDAPTVSRRHARLVVSPEGVSLEDIGSKNGTRCGSHGVTSPVHLADGDTIHFGSVLLTFRLQAYTTTTATQSRAR